MPSSFWVASTKPGAALDRSKLVCLAKGEGGLWRRVIAGQKPTCIAGRGLAKRKVEHEDGPARGRRIDVE